MKLVSVIVLSLFMALPARAFELTCYTEYLTTTYIIWTSEDNLYARVIHHNGAEFAPAFAGIYTPHDIPILERRANLVKQMQNDTIFRWKTEKCKFSGGSRFECFGTDDVQYGKGGEKIKPYALYSSESIEDGIAGKYEYLWLRLSFDVNGESGPAVEMKYPRMWCKNRKLSEAEISDLIKKRSRPNQRQESDSDGIHLSSGR